MEVEASIDRKSDIEVRTACEDMYEDGTVDPVYQAKARLLNSAIQEIGMGKYQVRSQKSSRWCWRIDRALSSAVVSLHRRRVRLVRVCTSISLSEHILRCLLL